MPAAVRHIAIQICDFAFVLVRVDASECSVEARPAAHRGTTYRAAWTTSRVTVKGADEASIKRAATHPSARSFRSLEEMSASIGDVTIDDYDFAY